MATVRASILVAAGTTAVTASAGTLGQSGAEASVRLERSTSGTKGRQEGNRYIIEDPRNAFSAAEDRQVIVLFEWEGRPGLQRCEARWKDPTGRVVMLSAPIDYQANSRSFSVYWTLALPEAIASGLWAVETSVNGVAAGTHTFEVTGLPAPAPGRGLLSQAELYERAASSVATVEQLGTAGELLGRGPAVALDGDHVITLFSLIDGATSLRLYVSGRTLESREVGEWDRRNGWAVLRFPSHGLTALTRSNASLGVGGRCFVLDSGDDGSRVIIEAAIVGQGAPPASRPRLNSGFAAGSPLLDENGDLAGIVAAPGTEEQLGPTWLFGLNSTVHAPRGMAVLLADRLPGVSNSRVSLEELAARGEFMTPLSPEQRNIISGVFAARVQRGGAVPMPQDQRQVFSRREGQLSLFIQWNPQTKKDAVSHIQVYDSDYRTVVKGEPGKVKLRPGNLFFTTSTLAIDRLPVGVYRVDLLLDNAPAWRGYVKVSD